MDNNNIFLNQCNNTINELNTSSFFNPNWDLDHQNEYPFESALSSIVSSPTGSNSNAATAHNNGENIVLRELIGRLGTIGNNSGEISPFNGNGNNNITSANTSCYNTPLNSPPKLNLMGTQQIHGNNNNSSNYPPFSTDPAFAERAARFSCFGNMSLNSQMGLSEFGSKLDSGKISRVSSNQSIKIIQGLQGNNNGELYEAKFATNSDKKLSPENTEFVDSRENSSLTGQIPGGEIGLNLQNDSRKRKSVSKGKGKEIPAKESNVVAENSESSAKRSKSDEENKEDSNQKQSSNDNSKPIEAPKDYIHVRARRGQATDAHSLAERVRREKIGERMKFLQDLVPGCNKVTGKAVMLDEIINYVQSLQRQVEFLSMKLTTIDSKTEFNTEAVPTKDVYQARVPLPHELYPSDCYSFQSQPNLLIAMPNGTEGSFPVNQFNAAFGRNQLPPMDSFRETTSQASAFWGDDLHSVVQMGYGQNESQDFHGIRSTAQTKVEL